MMEEKSKAPMLTRISASVGGLLISSIESLARISLGQTVLKLIDRMLWVVEKSAQWSLPPQEMATDENGKSFGEIELVRPLPWIFFFPTLIFLRVLKAGVNVGAFIMGYPTIQPSGVVRFVQQRRRQFRTIKNNGLKSIRAQKMLEAKDRGLANIEDRKSVIRWLQQTLYSLSCLDNCRVSPSPPPESIRMIYNSLDATTEPSEENSITESATSPHHGDSKRKYDEVAPSSSDEDSNQSEEETLISQVDRLASEDSIDDPDFVPLDGGSSDGTTDSSIEDEEVLLTEAQQLIEEAKNDLPKFIQSLKESTPESVQKAKAILMLENSDARYGVEFSEERESYYSPNNFGTDGELAFYSPISSKSVSPERTNSPTNSQLKRSNAKPSDLGNGEVKAKEGPVSSENDISRVSRKDVTNGNGHVEGKKSANSGKCNPKHRRTSHGNRKKK